MNTLLTVRVNNVLVAVYGIMMLLSERYTVQDGQVAALITTCCGNTILNVPAGEPIGKVVVIGTDIVAELVCNEGATMEDLNPAGVFIVTASEPCDNSTP